ncbi:hypothetical protein VNO77_13454 [Canavalia gladiata]|uniref:Uncharacterized protein n=1 Tax=Canavalia gladiata TaxID=3824 RepID=A0AAN9LXU6_CANGL
MHRVVPDVYPLTYKGDYKRPQDLSFQIFSLISVYHMFSPEKKRVHFPPINHLSGYNNCICISRKLATKMLRCKILVHSIRHLDLIHALWGKWPTSSDNLQWGDLSKLNRNPAKFLIEVTMLWKVVYKHLLLMADFATPNLKEASVLVGDMPLNSVLEMHTAAKLIRDLGPRLVV